MKCPKCKIIEMLVVRNDENAVIFRCPRCGKKETKEIPKTKAD